MKSDEERLQAEVPLRALRQKARFCGVNASSTFRYEENPDILHESQLNLLSELIDFAWEKTALLAENVDIVDMRLTLSGEPINNFTHLNLSLTSYKV